MNEKQHAESGCTDYLQHSASSCPSMNFSVTYRKESNTVSVSKNNVSPENFDKELFEAHNILRLFRQSKPGSIWGCDGVGYAIQKATGVVQVHKSGVGPKKFQEGWVEYKAKTIS